MNERIKEFMRESGVKTFFPGDPGSGAPGPEGVYFGLTETQKLEKFAELIVREYEKLLPEICPWADADKEGPMKGWHVQFVARKHFGVKE